MSGHGHVVRRADGVKARCGGPSLCQECARELAALQEHPAEAEMREITCETCNGDGMFEVNQGHGVVGEIMCRDCDGVGRYAVEMKPITVEDLGDE